MSAKLALNRVNVANYMTACNLVAGDTEMLSKAINETLHKSGVIQARIRRALAERLKIATGELIDTIDFNVSLDKDNPDTLSITIITDGHNSKLNALLGEDELNAHSSSLPMPDMSISSIATYIRAKKNLFNTVIRDIKDSRMERLAFQTQRRNEIINRFKYNTKKVRAGVSGQRDTFINGQRNMEKFDDESIIMDYAETIRNAMNDRMESGLSYTYGSSRSLLGFKKADKRNGIIPIYKKNMTPLLTLDTDDGLINQIYNSYIGAAINGMMKHAGVLVSTGQSSGNINTDLNDYFERIKESVTVKGKVYYDIMDMADDVNTLLATIEKSKGVNISKLYMKDTPYAKNAAEQIDNIYNKVNAMYHSSSLQEFSLAKKDVDRMIKQINSDTRKILSRRKATRRRGR